MKQKQAIKMKFENHLQFQQAWDALIKLGYQCREDLVPHTAPYLYTNVEGQITFDFFDIEGTDLSSPNSAAGSFAAHKHKEITLEELLAWAQENGCSPFQCEIALTKQERPLFESNYVSNGGSLQYLKWDECDNGAGSYVVDWEAVDELDAPECDFNDEIMAHAEHVTSCLCAWVQCAKSKAIPAGYYVNSVTVKATSNTTQ